MNVRHIPADQIALYWQEAALLIDPALKHGRGRFNMWRLYEDLIEADKRLWVVIHGETMTAAVVTCVTDFPEKRVATVLFCGGEDVDAWVRQVLAVIEDYAHAQECEEVEIIGRPGWQRKCPDYELAGLWLVKELSR